MTQRPENGNAAEGWSPRERAQGGERLFHSQKIAERPGPWPAAEVGAALERQILLDEGPADEAEVRRPAGTRRGGWLIAATVLAVLGATGAVAFVEDRRGWEGKVSALEARLGQLSAESGQRIEALRKDGAEKDRIIAERKTENQSLAALMDKTLAELKSSLDDLRRERERNEKLAADYQKATVAREPLAMRLLKLFVPPWKN